MPPKKKQKIDHGGIEPHLRPLAAASLPISRSDWPGWCDIESEPAVFNVMLEELGVEGLRVDEVLSLDEAMLATLPKPVHAVVLLSEYKASSDEESDAQGSDEVWFANQNCEGACASIALLNIVNNIPDLRLGPELQSFRDRTLALKPVDRAYAIADYDFCRHIHNSFGHDQAMLAQDLELQRRYGKQEAQRKAAATRAAKAAAKENGEPVKRTPKKAKPEEIIDDADGQPAGNHFIAYLPVGGHLWELDGYARQPRSVARLDSGTNWLEVLPDIVQIRIESQSERNILFNLMAIVHDPLEDLQKKLAATKTALQALDLASSRTDRVKGDEVESGVEDRTTLLTARKELEEAHQRYSDAVAQRQSQRELDRAKARLHRHDFLPFLDAWAAALKEQNVLDTLVAKVRAS